MNIDFNTMRDNMKDKIKSFVAADAGSLYDASEFDDGVLLDEDDVLDEEMDEDDFAPRNYEELYQVPYEDLEEEPEEKLRNIFAYKKEKTIHVVEIARYEAESQYILMERVAEEVKRGAIVMVEMNGADERKSVMWYSCVFTIKSTLNANVDCTDPDRIIICPEGSISTKFIADENGDLCIYVPSLEASFDLDSINRRMDNQMLDEEAYQSNIRRGVFRKA